MHDFLYRQSNISGTNLKRLRLLEASANPRTAELASVVLAIAHFAPGKRKRIGRLRHDRPDLFEKLEVLGFLPPGFDVLGHMEDDDSEFEFALQGLEENPMLPPFATYIDRPDEEIPI
jgi:hypothetical protein